MGRTLQIGQTCQYWTKGASKPLAAIVLDVDGSIATLSVLTPTGGRFMEAAVEPKFVVGGSGWTEIGQEIR